jgi:hypothetical protein
MNDGLEIPPPVDMPQRPEDLDHPPQPSPLYDLRRLDDPPDDFEFMGVTYHHVKQNTWRFLKIDSIKVLMKHYFWGIQYKELDPPRGKRRPQSLKSQQMLLFKLWYYMQEEHLPKTWGAVLDVNRDSGPRLLRYDLNPRPKPLSRWYPIAPDISTRILDAYLRPLHAPPDMPDYLLQQYLYSADSLFTPPASPLPPPPTEDARLEENTRLQLLSYLHPDAHLSPKYALNLPTGPPTTPPGHKRTAVEALDSPGKRRRNLSPGAPAFMPGPHRPPPVRDQEPVFAADSPKVFTWVPSLTPHQTVPPPGKLQLGPLVPPGPLSFDPQKVMEAVERAVMQFVYDDLERDPRIHPNDKPPRYLTAQCFDDMLPMKIGAFPLTEKVKLSPLDLFWDPNGTSFLVRGRGPVWGNKSCATDVVIVAGMLLDAGCTKIDRAHNRTAQFTDLEKAYIEITNASWETLDAQTSMQVRDEFLRLFIDGQSTMEMGKPLPPWALWSVATKSFAQFRYHHAERVTPCKCRSASPFINSHQGSCILPAFAQGDELGVDLQTLIERCFYKRKTFKCRSCHDPNGVVGERKIGQLPPRLVMTFDLKTRLIHHTDNLKFNYVDYEDKPQVAHYRWLGGVYNNQEHARIYWTDAKRGEQNTNIIMYDSQVTSGVIVGGIPQFAPNERVPTDWVSQNAIPMLFFERIMNPTNELLATAQKAVSDMANTVAWNENVLDYHVPWSIPEPPAKSEPWDRILSDNGQRFSDFNPEWATSDTPPNAASKPISPVSLSNIDMSLLDPAFLDPALLDPSLYPPSSTPPPFDDAKFFDLSTMNPPTTDSWTTLQTQQPIIDKNHPFASMTDAPDWLIQNPELWPSGPPTQEGALDFPDFLAWTSPRASPKRSPNNAGSQSTSPKNSSGLRNNSGSDISMPDADILAPMGRRPSFRVAHADRLKKAAIANYAIAKQALNPRQRQRIYAQRKQDDYDSRKRFGDEEKRKEESDQKKRAEEQEKETKRMEEKKKQEEKRLEEEERRKGEEKRQEEEGRKKAEEERQRQEEEVRAREEEENREKEEKKKPKKAKKLEKGKTVKKKKTTKKEKTEKGEGDAKMNEAISRRPGLRNSRKPSDPTWKPSRENPS